MLEKIVANNIECHVNSHINFAKGITAITGSSESGKSSIQRLIESFLYFKPMKLRYDEVSGGVEFHTSKGVLTRYREDVVKYRCGSCKNTYKKTKAFKCQECGSDKLIIDRTKKYDIYSIYGNTLDEIRDVLKNSEISKDPRTRDCCFEKMSKGFKNLSGEIIDSMPFPLLDICKGNPWAVGIKQQFDKFIWDELKPAEFSRLFSHLEGQDYIHNMVEFIKRDIKEDKSLVKVLKPEIVDLADKLKSSKEVLQRHKNNYDKSCKSKDEFSDLYTSWVEIFDAMARFDKTVEEGMNLKKNLAECAYRPWEGVQELLVSYVSIMVSVSKYSSVNADFKAVKEEYEGFKLIPIIELEQDLKNINKLKFTYDENIKVKQEISVLNAELQDVIVKLDSGKDKFEKLIMNQNICPYSGFPLVSNCKKLILEKLK